MYTITSGYTTELVKHLPKKLVLDIDGTNLYVSKEWLMIVSRFFNNMLSEMHDTHIKIEHCNKRYFIMLINLIEESKIILDNEQDVLEVLLLVQKYEIIGIDIDSAIDQLRINNDFFTSYIEYVSILYDTDKTKYIDSIAKKINPTIINKEIREMVKDSPELRNYPDKYKDLIFTLEDIANNNKKEPKSYIFKYRDEIFKQAFNDVYRNGYIDQFNGVSLNKIFRAHSTAEVILKLRDYIIYSMKNYPNFLLYKSDIFQPYIIRTFMLYKKDINWFKLQNIDEQINQILETNNLYMFVLE